ncbi:unnamed protein product [Ectocarpus fasciculatus]
MRAASPLALTPLLLVASLASVADGSLGINAAGAGPPAISSVWTRRRDSHPSSVGLHRKHLSLDLVARLRGGVKRATVKADDEDDDADENDDVDTGPGALSALTGLFKNMPPATRVYVLLLMVITAVDVSVGKVIDSGNTFSMDWGRTVKGLELWRPLTSLVYLGPLSMSWLTNVYFLTQHGTRLELVSGTAEQVIFLLVVGSLLLFLGPLIGMPLMSTSMVAAHTYVSARMDPLGSVQFQFLRIPMWTLPFAQMGAAVLQEEGNPLAAIPHFVGILCGHVYHFFTVVHPLMGAKRRLGAPGWMKRRLDGGDNPNFMETPDEPAAPRGRKIGAGKKTSSKSKSKTKTSKSGSRGSKKGGGKARPVPDFPTADGGGCS